jgi:PAS domain S-box-containing protein
MSAVHKSSGASGPTFRTPGAEYAFAGWEFASDAMAVSDRDAVVLAANRAYLELYGYSAEEVIGHNFAIIFPEELRAWANAEYHKTFADPHIAPAVESTIRRQDGSERMVEARYTFVTEGDERTAMVSIVRDITDQKRAAAALQESEAKFRSLVTGNIIGILRADMEQIVEANDVFLQMVGYTADDLRAGHVKWREMTPPEWAAADDQALAEMLERGACTPFEKEYIRKDGERLPILIGASLLTRDPLTWMCFVLDLRERKQAEANEREARLVAESAVRDRDRLLSIVVHDLRNPLASIQGAAQLLARRLARNEPLDRERLSQMIEQIDRSAVRMNSLITEILDFSQMQAGVRLALSNRPTDLVELVGRVVEECRQNSPKHQIVFAAEVTTLVGEWDPPRLERIIANLLDNAVKYSPPGSAIRVEIQRANPAGAPGRATVTVTDQGAGIPTADLPHVFEWYRRGTNVETWTTGTGIGLAGARQIVEQYGGTITVESVEGQGSTFTVVLPLVASGALGSLGKGPLLQHTGA